MEGSKSSLGLPLVGLGSRRHKLESPGRRVPQLKGVPPSNWPFRQITVASLRLLMWPWLTVVGVTPRQVVLGLRRNVLERELRRKSGNSVPVWSLFQYLPPGSYLSSSPGFPP